MAYLYLHIIEKYLGLSLECIVRMAYLYLHIIKKYLGLI